MGKSRPYQEDAVEYKLHFLFVWFGEIIHIKIENMKRTATSLLVIVLTLFTARPSVLAQTGPFHEGFDDGALPDCWTIMDADGDGNCWDVILEPSFAHNGDGMIISGTWGTQTDNWLVTPAITIPQNAILSFWAIVLNSGNVMDTYSIYVATNNSDSAFLATTPMATGETTGTWERKLIDLSPFAGQTVYIAFRHNETNDWYYLGLDDIEVTCCPLAESLSIGNVSGTTATVTWQQNGLNEPDHYELSYKVESDSSWTIVSPIHSNNYLLDNLSPTTGYLVRLRVFCDDTTASDYLENSFITDCICCPPSSLEVNDISGTAAMVTWENNGLNEPHHYELTYKTEEDSTWTIISPINTNFYLLTNLSPTTKYNVKVRLFCDDTTSSNWLERTFRTECLDGTSDLVIGKTNTSNQGNYFPVGFDDNYSYTQQIYHSDEIGEARPINAIDIQYFYGTPESRTVDIYLGHTQQSGFTSGYDWVPNSDLTLVYSGSVMFDNTGDNFWCHIPFTTTFEYNGVDNLVLAFYDKTGSSYNSWYERCYTHSTPMSFSKRVSSYGILNVANIGSYYGYIPSYRNNIRFPGICVNNACERPLVSAVNVTDSSAQLTVSSANSADGFELEYRQEGNDVYSAISATSTSILLTGLRQNTQYDVRVRSICDGNYSSWKKTTFTTGVGNHNRLYVSASGIGDGTSWTDAANDLQWALNTAQVIKNTYSTTPEIWVSAGTYYGDTSATSQNAFTMVEGVNVYGGFAGYEPADYDLAQRDFTSNTTILDGQNARRVLYQPLSYSQSTLWDGFTIQHGYVPSEYSNLGGGARLLRNGGLSHCVVKNNSAYEGGGVYVCYAPSFISNCLITNNTATYGGGIDAWYATVTNNTIVRNTATYGAGISGNSAVQSVNNIVWGNGTNPSNNVRGDFSCTYSAIEGGWDGTGNIALSDFNPPLFVNPSAISGISNSTENDDWRLQAGSPCINRGDNSAATDSYDLDGTTRIKRDTVDMGCFESDYYSSPLVQPNYSGIVYVTQEGAGAQTGEDWANATASISFAISMAKIYDADVWVAAGTYYGDTSSTSQNAFTMMNGVNVYGGFAGNEPEGFDLSLRDFGANATILDGQNARRVLHQSSNFDIQTTWDGFTIQNGSSNDIGGGVNIFFNGNISHCIIKNNITAYQGGGIYAGYRSTVTNCVISNNSSNGNGGGVYANETTISNCLISNNTANSAGGGVYLVYYNLGNSPNTITNSTIVRNIANNGAGVYIYDNNEGEVNQLTNSIVWGNGSTPSNNIVGDFVCTYSAIEGGYSGEHNIILGEQFNQHPMFVQPTLTSGADDTSVGDWHLQQGSICINHGNDTAVVDSLDLDGTARIKRDTVDLGCYESDFYSVPLVQPDYSNIIYVTQNGSGNQTGENWANATSSIAGAMEMAHTYNADVWVAAGTYYGDTTADNAFTMVEGVDVYGGFAGDEPADYDLSLRDFDANATILDGQHERRVLFQPNSFNTITTWDGFTIQNGQTFGGSSESNNGGGVKLAGYGKLSNCLIQNNISSSFGGGVEMLYGYPNYLYNCRILNNTAPSTGGVNVGWTYSDLPASTIINCQISNNNATWQGAGGVSMMNGNISNCLISNNFGGSVGGLGINSGTVSNTTIVRNEVFSWGFVSGVSGGEECIFTNCIIWGNGTAASDNIFGSPTCSYSAIEGGFEGEGNIPIASDNDGIAPDSNYVRFVNTTNNDFRLAYGSACINMGTLDTSGLGLPPVDLLGSPRIMSERIDMGAYEYNSTSVPVVEIYDTICNGNIVTFFGSEFDSTGRYMHHTNVESVSDTLYVLYLQVYPSYSVDSVFQMAGNGYNRDGQTYTQSGTYIFNYTNIYGCDSIIRIMLYDSLITLCDNQLPFTYGETSFPTGTVSGLYPVSSDGQNAFVYLQINPTYSVYDTLTHCENQWWVDVYVGDIQFNDSLTGDYTVTLQSACGCDSIVYLHYTVNPTYWFDLYDTIPRGTEYSDNGFLISANETRNHRQLERYNFQYTETGCDSTFVLHLTLTGAPPIRYVTQDGVGDGSSWANAMGNLQAAIDSAALVQGDVWVAQGVYYGDTSTSSENAFIMANGVNVYGSFAGNEPEDYDLSLRDFETNTTILDGQHLRRVLYQPSSFNTETIWDGFTIQNGHSSYDGGGVYLGNNGKVSQCVIIRNNTGDDYYNYGGGVYAYTGSTIVNCRILSNTASNGGGLFAYNSTIANCLIANNTSSYSGGGIYIQHSTISNSTIVRNSSIYTDIAGVYNGYGGSILTNCIVWGNGSTSSDNISGSLICSYSAIEGGYEGERNITLGNVFNLYPLFVNPSLTAGASDSTMNVDWHLQPSSPCINRGDNDAVIEIIDLDGTARIKRDTVDMGCYESDYYSVPVNQLEYSNIIYVTQTGSGTQTGENWENATSSIEIAQNIARTNNAVVWVAAGTYYGDTSATAENAFTMSSGVNVYGGFAGNEPDDYDLSLRDFETNTTILDGQQERRVLFQPSSFNTETIWDGFTIQNGHTSQNGGGAYLRSNGKVSQCVIQNNIGYSGGGVYAYAFPHSEVSNCQISNNISYYQGGGIYTVYATISNCLISHNTTYNRGGGGIYAGEGAAVQNCLITNNSVPNQYGGGIYANFNSTISNTTIARNSAYNGDAIYCVGDEVSFINCIVWGNGIATNNSIIGDITCSHSAIEGGYEGDNNIALSDLNPPRFVNPSLTAGTADNTPNVDWHLQQESVCINRGDNTAVTDSLDLDGTARIKRDTVDIGCYESDYYSSPLNQPEYSNIIYVTQNGSGTQTGESWDNATSSIAFALSIAQAYHADVWVAAGTYYGDTTAENAFTMENVNVFGGFAGNEPNDYNLSLRDFETNTTSLDGQNARRVLFQPNEFNTQTIWDGFTIQNGQTTSGGGGAYLKKNGMLRNCVIQYNHSFQGSVICLSGSSVINCRFSNNTANYGGGVNAYNSTVSDCSFTNNTAYVGGGIRASNSNISNCYITNNTASASSGGLNASNSTVTNCLILNNTANYAGGLSASNSTISNCLISNNTANYGDGGVSAYDTTVILNTTIVRNITTAAAEISGISGDEECTLTNCIVWGNGATASDNISGSLACSYSAIEGGYEGDNNITLSELNPPLFVNQSLTAGASDSTENVDWHLLQGSPCINSGNNAAVTDSLDLDGTARIKHGTVDLGCYESDYGGGEPCSNVVYEFSHTACNSYEWNGQTYAQSGEYVQTFALENGCDSVVTLHLSVNQPTTDTDMQTACGSFTWIDGITYTESNSTATYTLTNAVGCDSVVTLNLTIFPADSADFAETVCGSYEWNGETFTTSGDYTRTFTNANGCDSIVTLHLTVNQPNTGVDVQTACGSYTWIDGITYTESNNTATYTLANAAGCDSVVTLNLTINQPTTGTDAQTACGSYTWIDGITYTESNNTATYTLTNAAGCDSIVTLNLTIFPADSADFAETACDSFEWNGETFTSSGDFTRTLTNASGCDSVVTLHLTIQFATSAQFADTACGSYEWNGQTYSSSGDYEQTFTAANDCDSVVTLHLTVNQPSTGTDVQTACGSYTWIDGITYTESNSTATYTLTNAIGCDSIVTLNLTIFPADSAEFAETACGSYEWNGETFTTSGDYTRTLTNMNGCDSVVTLHLTIHFATSAQFADTTCGSYEWNGQNYTSSGDFEQTFTAANGCDSVVTLHLTVNQPTTGTDVQTACGSYTWIDGITYTESNNTATYTLTNAV
ncbi:MAG: right-handed parallel beta-helix repeat-containing protein, partial [Bacteroidales bacterium]|nr:right-handed parallel beta-helix repeat-containing protein [Bacteroidales bacterium]